MALDLSLSMDLYRQLFLLRKSEEKIMEFYHEDEMKTPMHMSMGSEAINVGVCSALQPKDKVFGSYRSHALFLAKTNNPMDFFLELYCRKDGACRGKSGSMHLACEEQGHYGSSGVVASGISVSAGTAFAEKYKQSGQVVAIFHGDGAMDAGVFWETLNFSCLKELPLIFVCEDNSLAVHTVIKDRQRFDVPSMIKSYGCSYYSLESTDVEDIYLLSSKASQDTRRDMMPCFLHLKYYRYLEHVGISYDFDAGYRSEKEFLEWKKIDPITLQRTRLERLVDEEQILSIEMEVMADIDRAVKVSKEADNSDQSELFTDIYS